MNDDGFYLQLKTIKSSAIRILFESLKEILTDVNIVFSKDHVKIIETDGTDPNGFVNVAVHLKLETDKFEHYYCSKDLVVGVNMNSLFKLIKTVNNSDTISFFIQKDTPDKLNIMIENEEKRVTYKYSLLEVENKTVNIPVKQFESVILYRLQIFKRFAEICRIWVLTKLTLRQLMTNSFLIVKGLTMT